MPVGKFVLKDVEFKLETYQPDGQTLNDDETDLTDHVQSITVSVEVDTPEATAMTDLDRVRLYGLRQWSMEVTFFQDFASGNVDDTVWDIINNARFVELRMKPDSTTTFGPNNPQYSGRAVLPQHNPVAGAVGEVSTITITFQSSGQLSRTTS